MSTSGLVKYKPIRWWLTPFVNLGNLYSRPPWTGCYTQLQDKTHVIHKLQLSHDDLQAELKVLQRFKRAWLRSPYNRYHKKSRDAQFAAYVFYVRASHHRSDDHPNAKARMTVNVYSRDDWRHRRATGAQAFHVLSVNEDPSKGFKMLKGWREDGRNKGDTRAVPLDDETCWNIIKPALDNFRGSLIDGVLKPNKAATERLTLPAPMHKRLSAQAQTV